MFATIVGTESVECWGGDVAGTAHQKEHLVVWAARGKAQLG